MLSSTGGGINGAVFLEGIVTLSFSFLLTFFEEIGRVGSSKKLSISLLFLNVDGTDGFAFYIDLLAAGLTGDASRSSSKSKSSCFFVTIGAGFVSVFLFNFLYLKSFTSYLLTWS